MASEQLVESDCETSAKHIATSDSVEVEPSERSQPDGGEAATQYADQRRHPANERTTSAAARRGSCRGRPRQPTSRLHPRTTRRQSAGNVDRAVALNQSLSRLALRKSMSATAMSQGETTLVDLHSGNLTYVCL